MVVAYSARIKKKVAYVVVVDVENVLGIENMANQNPMEMAISEMVIARKREKCVLKGRRVALSGRW